MKNQNQNTNPIQIPENALIIPVGLPGSGVTRVLEERLPDAEVISTGTCREIIAKIKADIEDIEKLVFQLYQEKIKEALGKGGRVVADGTNLTHREDLYDLAQEFNIPVFVLVFNVPLKKIIDTNAERARKKGSSIPEKSLYIQFYNFRKAYESLDQETKNRPNVTVIDIVIRDEPNLDEPNGKPGDKTISSDNER